MLLLLLLQIHVWGFNGDLLASVDTKQVQVHAFSCSPADARFFAVAAWAPGIKVFEMKRDNKTGMFSKLVKAMDLKSRQGTRCVAISFDNRRAVTVQKHSEGKASLWNIDVRYIVNEEPRLMGVIPLAAAADAENNKLLPEQQQQPGGEYDAAASAVSRTSAAGGLGTAAGRTTGVSPTTTAEREGAEDVEEEAFRRRVSLMSFSPDGKFLICAADRHLRFIRLKQQEDDFGERPENAFSHASIAATIPYAHQNPIHTLLVPPLGDFILTASVAYRVRHRTNGRQAPANKR